MGSGHSTNPEFKKPLNSILWHLVGLWGWSCEGTGVGLDGPYSATLICPFHVLEGCSEVFPEPSVLQAQQSQLSQPVTTEALLLSNHFYGRPLDPLQHVHGFTVLRMPELDAALQVRVSRERRRGAESPPLLPSAETILIFKEAFSDCGSLPRPRHRHRRAWRGL